MCEIIARELAEDLISSTLAETPKPPRNLLAKTMRRCVEDFRVKYGITFKGMMGRLKISDHSCYSTFKNVADELFADRKMNWGRVVALYAFGSELALRCEHDGINDVKVIPSYLATFVADNLSVWIRANGGWNGLCKHFGTGNNIWIPSVIFAAIGVSAYVIRNMLAEST